MFAAASLTNTLDDAARLFKQQSGVNAKIAFLIAPPDSSIKVEIKPAMDLAALLCGGRLAMAEPDSVPAGKYGKAALEKPGIWNSVKPAVAPAESVRAALAFVSHREAPLGIVYATDAAADPGVKVVAAFPEDTHPPIVYRRPLPPTARTQTPSGCSTF